MKLSVAATAILNLLSCVLGTLTELNSYEYPENSEDCRNFTTATMQLNSDIIEYITIPTIECLTIKNSGISVIRTGAFSFIPNLKYLDLSNNKIPSRDLMSFGSLPTLRTLIINNQVSYSYDLLTITNPYPELRYLSLRNSNIRTVIFSQTNALPKLTHLDISQNKISDINLNPCEFKSLTHLNLSHNDIYSLGIQSLNNLSWLSLNKNRLSYIYFDFHGMQSLMYLSIRQNKIRQISTDAFADLVNLRYLDMSSNQLQTLFSTTMGNLTSLEVLLLDSNLLDDLPSMLPRNLTTLSAKDNKLNVLTMSVFHDLPNLRTLDLGWNNISYLSEGTFQNQKLLEELNLNDNQLTHLPHDFYQNFEQLRRLDLSRNHITRLENVLLPNMLSVQHLYIIDNPIGLVTSNTLKGIPDNLTIHLINEKYDKGTALIDTTDSFRVRHGLQAMNLLIAALALLAAAPALASARAIEFMLEYEDDYYSDCENYTLTLQLSSSQLEKGFISSATVRCLLVQGGLVDYVADGAFEQMLSLKHLDLRGNRITPGNLFSYGNLTSVRTLLLSNQTVGYYGRAAYVKSLYPQLRHLDLSNTGLDGVSSAYTEPFPQLRHLDLSINKIVYPDFTSLLPQSLTHLLLNGNSISRFSAKKLTNLTFLQLDNNNIAALGNGYYSLELANMFSLRYLSVANNRISTIHRDTFNDTVHLRHLDLSYNALSRLEPATIVSLQQLEILILDGNSFEDIPATDIMNLTTLSMNCNKITRLTVNPLLNLPYLRTLYLGGNRISNVNAFSFRFQTNLQVLYLNDNHLSSLPNDWATQLKNLKRLDLSGNRFMLLDFAVQSMPSTLTHVYFERNPLQYVNTAAMRSTPGNFTIYMQPEAGRVARCKMFDGKVVALDGDDEEGLERLDATGSLSPGKTMGSESSPVAGSVEQ
nr:transforming growth factor beta activator LRRC33-like [Nomia melanderi]